MPISIENLLFAAASILAVGAAVALAASRSERGSAAALGAAFLGLAGLSCLLGAWVLAAAQVLVAFAAVFIRSASEPARAMEDGRVNRFPAAVVSTVAFLAIVQFILSLPTPSVPADAGAIGSPVRLGAMALTRHLLAFAILGVLAIVALVGAHAIARRPGPGGEGE